LTPSLELLEPRLLLSADPLGVESVVPPYAYSIEHAVCVNLDPSNQRVPDNDSATVLAYLASPLADGDGASDAPASQALSEPVAPIRECVGGVWEEGDGAGMPTPWRVTSV